MQDQQYLFNKKIIYSNRNDDNLFHIKYTVEKGNRSNNNNDQYKIQVTSPKKKQTTYVEVKKKQQYKEKTNINQQEIQELKKYSKNNNKKNNKKPKNNLDDEWEQYQQERYKPKNKKNKRYNLLNPQQPPLTRSRSINQYQPKQDLYNKRLQEKLKKIYQPYIPLKEIQQSRRNNQRIYYKGIVNCDERLKTFFRIKSDEFQGNLVAEGANMNRAIHEDIIYFRVIGSNDSKDRIKCKVVHILQYKLQKGREREIIGKIDMVKGKKIYVLKPINRRFNTFNIRLNEISKQWLSDRDNKYFRASYQGWPQNSQYPQCVVLGEYGQLGKIEVETGALLKTYGIYDQEYTEEQIEDGLGKFIKDIDQTGQYAISSQEISKRTDLRLDDIFTIDPLTARDFDDALSIRKINDEQRKNINFKSDAETIYQIGVHIADASYFVEQGSIIDQQAQIRTTSVYLVHRVIPMLPRILCETMCSLNPGLQRLTLSVWFYMDSNGIVSEGCRYDRSVIKSKARFTYQQAQKIIMEQIKFQKQIQKGYGCVKSEDFDKIANDIKIMNNLALKNKKRRVDGGSLIFEIPKKSFELNQFFHPISYNIKERFQANFLVEQFMLLANQKVAEVLVKGLNQSALLRRHKFPGEMKIAKFEQFMKKIGQQIKITRETKIQQEVDKILSKNIRKSIKDVIKSQMIFLLEMADYFLVGKTPEQDRIHYALNMKSYTHFTSPIRRYPDIIVHRQLISIIQAQKLGNKTPRIPNEISLQKIIQKCNINKDTAKKVSTACQKIFLCLYLKDHPVDATAIITSIEQWGFRISVHKYDFRTMIELKQLKNIKVIKKDKDSSQRRYLLLKHEEQNLEFSFVLKQLQEIQVRLDSTNTFPIDYKVNIKFPHPKDPNATVVIV